eukprot:scaffold655_cov105-Isochrysis_galbana.AAC.19
MRERPTDTRCLASAARFRGIGWVSFSLLGSGGEAVAVAMRVVRLAAPAVLGATAALASSTAAVAAAGPVPVLHRAAAPAASGNLSRPVRCGGSCMRGADPPALRPPGPCARSLPRARPFPKDGLVALRGRCHDDELTAPQHSVQHRSRPQVDVIRHARTAHRQQHKRRRAAPPPTGRVRGRQGLRWRRDVGNVAGGDVGGA